MGLGSEIRDPEKKPIPDPGFGSMVKKAPDPGSATLVYTSVPDPTIRKFFDLP
jgi:hypothetical protein